MRAGGSDRVLQCAAGGNALVHGRDPNRISDLLACAPCRVTCAACCARHAGLHCADGAGAHVLRCAVLCCAVLRCDHTSLLAPCCMHSFRSMNAQLRQCLHPSHPSHLLARRLSQQRGQGLATCNAARACCPAAVQSCRCRRRCLPAWPCPPAEPSFTSITASRGCVGGVGGLTAEQRLCTLCVCQGELPSTKPLPFLPACSAHPVPLGPPCPPPHLQALTAAQTSRFPCSSPHPSPAPPRSWRPPHWR